MTDHAVDDAARDHTGRHAVTTVELFFDLVFVFTLTNLSVLLGRPTWSAVGHVVLIFVVLYWMYGGYAWLTNEVPPQSDRRRLLMFAGMAAFLLCALAVPGAFGDRALAFGVGYLLVVSVHAAMYHETAGRDVVRFAVTNVIGAVALIVAAGLGDRPWARYGCWAVPIALSLVAPRVVRRAGVHPQARGRVTFQLDVDHVVERHGLLLLVALGESVVAVGAGASGAALDARSFAAAALGLALAGTFWWAYFDRDDAGAEAALDGAPLTRRAELVLYGYFYAFTPMLLGIVVSAAGVSAAVRHVDERLSVPQAWLLAAGVGLYLTGTVVFRRVMRLGEVAPRIAGAILALGSMPIGRFVGALAQLAVVVAIDVGVLVIERRTDE